MNCDRCGLVISAGEERNHNAKTLCEDCYMDALSPSVGCDPWANYIASKTRDETTGSQMNALQKDILDIIKGAGEISMEGLRVKLGTDLTMQKLRNEISTLRRMGMVLGRNDRGAVLFRYTG